LARWAEYFSELLNRPEPQEQLARWAEYFSELLNRLEPQEPPDILPSDKVLKINCDIPSRKEINEAVGLLKIGKAVGPNGIPAEALKADIYKTTEILHCLISNIWNKRY
jgi:hypothetical protein